MALTVLFSGCLWQSRALLDVLNRPMLALGAIFQLPVVMLVLGRVSRLGSATLRAKRRSAVVALAAVAAALPGTDPVTTLLELVALLALHELSIVMLRTSERRRPSVPE